jgi:beta-phosphoglucomutase-like phosphatase (HAD superfamily)
VVLEDAPAGILAGKAAGSKVIAVRTTHSDGELHEADVVVDDLWSLSLPEAPARRSFPLPRRFGRCSIRTPWI